MARMKLYEEEEMKEIQEAYKKRNKFPRKTLKQSEPSVFDLFDESPSDSPPPSPPPSSPLPPPPPLQPEPTQLSIGNVVEVREVKN
jgi:hypothetical protein